MAFNSKNRFIEKFAASVNKNGLSAVARITVFASTFCNKSQKRFNTSSKEPEKHSKLFFRHISLITGYDFSSVATNGTQTGLAAIIIDGEGRNRIVVYEGANAEIDPKEAAEHITDGLDLLLVQFETAEEVVVECVNRAISKGIATVIDCGPAKAFALEKMQGATIISPNESETKALTGISPDDDASILEAAKILMDRSKAKFVVLKLGSRGCAIWDGEALKIMPTYPGKVVDTTAAGDCFTAAMALEYIAGGDIYKACDMGNKAGTIAVGRMGAAASMPDINELLGF